MENSADSIDISNLNCTDARRNGAYKLTQRIACLKFSDLLCSEGNLARTKKKKRIISDQYCEE